MEIIQTYAISEIILIICAVAAAVKGFITFWDWAIDRLKRFFDKDYQIKKDKENIEKRFDKGSQIMETLTENQKELFTAIQTLTDKMDMLIHSDKEDIKSFLTKEHHYFCYQKGWIDDFSLECCEKRFYFYQQEGGNSFIEGFMNDLRNLPKVPPNDSQSQ